MIQTFDITVNKYGNLTYKVDLDLENMIQAVFNCWRISITAQITAVEERDVFPLHSASLSWFYTKN